jgi:hypothetical protein
MPEADGKLTLRLNMSECLDLQWAVLSRMRELSKDRATALSDNQRTQAENEIIRLGSILEKLPTHYPRKEELDA